MNQNKNSSLLLWLAFSLFIVSLVTGSVLWSSFSSIRKHIDAQRVRNISIKKDIILLQNRQKNTRHQREMVKNPIHIYEYFAQRIQYSGLVMKRYSLDMKNDTDILPLEIELLGDYPDLINFFDAIKIKSFEYSIQKIALRHTDIPGHTLEAQIYLNVPRRKE